MKKKILSLILTVAMLLTVMPMALAADEYSDVQGHWGEAAIDRWTQAGVAVGREEGTFAPDAPMTRGEAAQVLANLLRLKKEANISQYGDMDPSSSYYTAMAQCVAAGIFNGTSDTTMSPDSELTREQLFAIFARALGVQPVSSSSVIFADSDKVSDWALGYINALAELGAVRGVGNSELQPQADINRASVMSLLDQTISVYADTNGATVGESSGIVLVVADQVNVMGNVENLVVAGGSASVTSGSVENASLVGNATVSVSGSVTMNAVVVSGEGASLNVSGQATVGSVAVAASATGASVEVTGSATVNTVATQANSVTISGDGTVNSAVVSGSNTIVNTTGTNLTVSAGTTGVTQNGSAVSGGSSVETTPSTPGTSGGSGTTTPSNPTTPPVYIPNFYSVAFQNADGTPISSYTAMEYSAVQFPTVDVLDGEKVTWYENGTLLTDTSSVIVTSNRTFTAVVGSASFTAGNGTQEYPYLIANSQQLSAINKISDPYYYKQIADINLNLNSTTGTFYVIEEFYGTYDGGNYSIIVPAGTFDSSQNYSSLAVYVFYFIPQTSTIKNLQLYCNQDAMLSLNYVTGNTPSWDEPTNCTVTFENITVNNVPGTTFTTKSQNSGCFTCHPWGSAGHTVILKNCVNNASYTIAPTKWAGIFIAGYGNNDPGNNYSQDMYIQFINCVNNGTVQGDNVAMFVGNPSGPFAIDKIVVSGCVNNGQIIGAKSAGYFTTLNNSTVYQEINNKCASDPTMVSGTGSIRVTAVAGMALTKDEATGELKITEASNSSISYYVINMLQGFPVTDSSSTVTISKRYNAGATSDTEFYIGRVIGSDKCENYGITAPQEYNEQYYAVVTKDDGGKTEYYYVYDITKLAAGANLDGAGQYSLSAYDASGNLLGTVLLSN